MIAVDSNILVYSHRKDSPWHSVAARCLKELAEGAASWAIPWPCLHEFYAIVTHPGIYSPPSSCAQAMDQMEAWLEAPGAVILSESTTYWPALKRLLRDGRVEGGQVHDARVAALCLVHGVRQLWTADRDFSRFPALSVRNPLLSPSETKRTR